VLPEIVNVLTVDVEEYFHGIDFDTVLGAEGAARLPSRVVAQTERLLDQLDARGARGTFFTLGLVAQRYPRLIRSIVARGHELASHGWDHRCVYDLGAEGFRQDLRRAKRTLEAAAGRAVRGYRAPNYSIRRDTPWAFDVLAEEGFVYDSSVHPIVHDRYGFPHAPRFLHRVGGASGLWEVPVGTARAFGTNLPVGGGFFRLFPTALLTSAIASVNRQDGQPLVLYIHPWEFDPDQPRTPMPLAHRFRHYVGLAGATRKLETLLRQFRFTSIEDALAPLRLAPAAAVARAS
jgi:polysaccharide deacetylase family protein (PEP-CTERM system associated)